MGEYHTKICSVSTRQNLPEPEGAYSWLEQSSLQQATDASPLSAASPAVEEAVLGSTGTPLGALEVLVVLGSGAMETRSVPSLPAFRAQQGHSTPAQIVFRKEKSLSAPPRSQSYQSPLDFGICFERKITFTAGETSSSLRSVPVSSAFIGMNCCLH